MERKKKSTHFYYDENYIFLNIDFKNWNIWWNEISAVRKDDMTTLLVSNQ